jgi:hypothetical protein
MTMNTASCEDVLSNIGETLFLQTPNWVLK